MNTRKAFIFIVFVLFSLIFIQKEVFAMLYKSIKHITDSPYYYKEWNDEEGIFERKLKPDAPQELVDEFNDLIEFEERNYPKLTPQEKDWRRRFQIIEEKYPDINIMDLTEEELIRLTN